MFVCNDIKSSYLNANGKMVCVSRLFRAEVVDNMSGFLFFMILVHVCGGIK